MIASALGTSGILLYSVIVHTKDRVVLHERGFGYEQSWTSVCYYCDFTHEAERTEHRASRVSSPTLLMVHECREVRELAGGLQGFS